MNVLLVSPGGMLGRAWVALLEQQGLSWQGVRRPNFDVTRAETLETIDFAAYSHVINCSAFTDVDGAEEHEDEANAVNGEGVGRLARACAKANSVLIHYSTDYVFSGQASHPYPVDEPLAPLNAYGRSKALGERAIREAGGEHMIVRTSWLYAPWAKNFVLTMVKFGRERSELKVVHDQKGRPTSAEHLAKTTLALVRVDARGTLHVTDGGDCTWFEFARHIVGRANPECVVHPCSTSEFPRPAPRPAYSVLDLSATESKIGPMPPWTSNVDAVLDRVL